MHPENRLYSMTKPPKLIAGLLIAVLLATGVSAVDQLISLQGKVTQDGSPVDDGNIVVTIYNQSTGGTLIYNSTSNYNNAIQDGYFDVMLGSQTALDLNYNQYYWLDIEINGVDIDWSGAERKRFESGSGDTISDNMKIESGHLRVCQSDDYCIKIEQTDNANFTTNTGDIYIDPEGNNIYLNGKTRVSSSLSVDDYLTIKGGRLNLNGTADAGDFYQNSNFDLVFSPEGGDIIFELG